MPEDENDNVIRVNFGASKEDETIEEISETEEEETLERSDLLSSLFKIFIEEGETGVVLLKDAEGVDIPDGVGGVSPVLRLNFSYRYAGADLFYDDTGLSQTLNFGGTHYKCYIPWDAVVAFRTSDRLIPFGHPSHQV